MANHYSTQAGAGAHDGSSKANAWSLAEMASEWGTVANEVIFFDDSFTDLISVGEHSSAIIPLQVRFDDVGSEGDAHVATGFAFQIPGTTSRNDTHVFGGTFLSDDSSGVRIDSGVGLSGRHFIDCINDGNFTHAYTFGTTTGHDFSDYVFQGGSASDNGSRAFSLIVSGGGANTFSYDGLTINGIRMTGNVNECIRVNQEPGNTGSAFVNTTITNNQLFNSGNASGIVACRIGHFDSTHTNGKLILAYNWAIGCGNGTGGGGFTIQGFFTGNGIGFHPDGNWIHHNVSGGHGGLNGGINYFGCDGLAEWNITNDIFVDTGIIDGNGELVDNNCDDFELRYGEASRNLGSNMINSGVGVMVLFDTSNIRVHHMVGAGNKIGNWTAHNESTQTQADIEFWNSTYRDCVLDGFHQGSAGSPLVNTIMNCLYTGGTGHGMDNSRSPDGEDLVADYNLYDAFASGDYFQQAAGANDVTSPAPTFQADITVDDDFTGTDALTLDELPNGLWEVQGGSEGQKVIEISSNSVLCTNNGSGGAGVQTVYLLPDQGHHDHWIEATIDAGWTTETLGPYVAMRLTDVDNAIIMRIAGTGATGLRVIKIIAGVETQLITAQPTAGSTYRMEVHTETVELFKDGSSQGTATVTATELDPTITRAGMTAETSDGSAVQWTAISHGVSLPNMKQASNSSGVDVGTTNGEGYNIDPDGQPHGFGGTWDIGAFEFTSVIITDVSDDESWSDADTGIPITGTGFV